MFDFARLVHEHRHLLGKIFVEDREFTLQKRPQIPDVSVRNKTTKEIKKFFRLAAKHLHDETLPARIQIQPTSEFFLEKGYHNQTIGDDLLEMLINNRALIEKIFHGENLAGNQSVRPMCPDCRKGPRERTKVKILPNHIIQSTCDSEKCRGEYEIDVQQGNNNWMIYSVMLPPVRDTTIVEKEDQGLVHVFGGDYSLIPWGKDHIPKYQRMSELLCNMTPNQSRRINYTTGKVVKCFGKKLSKSEGHRTEIPPMEVIEQISASKDYEIHLEQLVHAGHIDLDLTNFDKKPPWYERKRKT